tara:strand:+ start:211 stop:579 length:369 start_codon:yes stop_codon:yes gene_type:complete
MAKVTLTFNAPLNASCQVGDIAYVVRQRQDVGDFSVNTTDIVEVGQIRQIDDRDSSTPVVTCYSTMAGDIHTDAGVFVLFSKDNKVNLSSILGYYAEVKLVNNSTTQAELFSVGMDMFESSK